MVREDEVPQVAGAVPEGSERIPETLAPEFRGDEPEPRDKGREYEEAQEDPLVFRGDFLKPWRDHRDDDVEAYQRIHEPEVTGHRGEVEGQQFEISQGLLPGHPAPKQRKEGVEEKEEHERGKDPAEAVLVERGHRLARFHGDEQEG